ncbi:hypothetical protein psal_cds_862 [Pandoravirus salinus]|uniref:Uncharacterized protein n=1 Tax=Pandoravirus salinus TaxID=1349410 RepID=A0A291ATU3_9VIRU|nr:hypothetical protein psal_cds_862 [Pandoravirus salinus]ATE82245.1 hypothetical protein psal_cds_862 [Pandoravirus salinus]
MGARMTSGLPTYDASSCEPPADLTLDGDDKCGGALQRPGANATDALRALYRRPQVHFCCTTAAMQRIDALALRLPIDHVCVATGASSDSGGMAWWVAMTPRSHRLLLASGVVVEVDRRRRREAPVLPTSTDGPKPPLCPPTPRCHNAGAPQETAPTSQAMCVSVAVAPGTEHKDAKGQPKRRRRRRQRGRARTSPGGRVAVAPLSV